jgi:hypothetical protein
MRQLRCTLRQDGFLRPESQRFCLSVPRALRSPSGTIIRIIQMDTLPVVLRRPLRLECELYRESDFTVYLEASDFRDRLWNAIRDPVDARFTPNELVEANHFDFQDEILFPQGGDDTIRPGRVHAALCFSGRYFSVTLRSVKPKLNNAPSASAMPFVEEYCDLLAKKERGVLIPDDIYPGHQELHDALRKVEAGGGAASGLVLIAGATGSGKTACLNALLTLYLREVLAKEKGRRPHVLAIGDPVESLLYGRRMESNSIEQSFEGMRQMKECRPVDFTARTLGVDTLSVHQGLIDALRETPTAVVVSELRDDQDFIAALRFAATGHLIFATSHNTSLVDAFGKLIEVTEATTPSDRSVLVQRLRAVIHLEPFGDKLRVPAFWRSTSAGKRNFVSDGLSSILAGAPAGVDDGSRGVLGRYWMLQQLGAGKIGPKYEQYLERALALDLSGR